MTADTLNQSRARAKASPVDGATAVPALFVYQGEVIHDRGEMLSLTDMWRAAGGDPSKQPAKWRELPGTREFSAHVADVVLRKSEDGVFEVRRGGADRGATWGHWQIAMAYAKYLSPEFHTWCNAVVRERMTGKPSAPAISPEIAEMIRRTDGIARMLSHKITEIEHLLPTIKQEAIEAALAADPRRSVLDYVSVRQLLDEAKALQKGRNRVNRKIGFEMRDRSALSGGVSLRRCPHSDVWLYPRGFADLYMAQRGKSLVADHNDRVMGQGVIRFPSAKKADDVPPPAPGGAS